ncbi:glycosyltransferase [Endobacter medicaginis]|nr:glycosyltransferase [Endobacter medicaginis]MCX5476525.1 glycosyltransferase [Endobacter medicaginis]
MTRGFASGTPSVVAIPACNEAGCIEACLAALTREAIRPPDVIVVLVNNTADDTAARAAAMSGHGSRVVVVERTFAPPYANAGHARAEAMRIAAAIAGPDGFVLTTDADGRVDPDWLPANLELLSREIDVVAGWVELDPADWARIPMSLHEADARECEYDDLCDRIVDRLDPDPVDPWPRHTQCSGASLALRGATFLACGGVPDVASGEDRALVDAARRIDARIRHAPQVHAHVSGRTVGRAPGGMAETIARRLAEPDLFLDDRLEPVDGVMRRARLRRRARLVHADRTGIDDLAIHALAGCLSLSACHVAEVLEGRYFGSAWAALEAASPVLARRRVSVVELDRELARARNWLVTARPVDRTDPAMFDV